MPAISDQDMNAMLAEESRVGPEVPRVDRGTTADDILHIS